jgi:hypothetical protein
MLGVVQCTAVPLTHRVELNAMTTPQFIQWLNGKMANCDKLIPPGHVLDAELANEIDSRLRTEITKRILREARLDAQVAAAVASLTKPTGSELEHGIRAMFEKELEREWRAHISAVVDDLARNL